jgi:hypothetical protein
MQHLRPRLASSSISLQVISDISWASGTSRGSVVKIPGTSVYISQQLARKAAARATAEVSEPPRPNVVISNSAILDIPETSHHNHFAVFQVT